MSNITKQEKLQLLLDEAVTEECYIDGIAILNGDNIVYAKSRVTNINAFLMQICPSVRKIIRKSVELESGSPERLSLVLSESIWTIFIMDKTQGFPDNFLVIFYSHHSDGSKILGTANFIYAKFLYNPNNHILTSTGSTKSIKDLLLDIS